MIEINEYSGSNVSTEARICIFSQRNIGKLVSRCSDYEFEDVICQVDNVDLITPQPYRLYAVGEKCVNRLARYNFITGCNPGMRSLRIKKNYELFFANFQFPRDVLNLNAVEGWKDHCRKSICFVDEVWMSELSKLKGHLKIMSKFDYVLLNCSGSVKAVQDLIHKPCFYIAPAVDMIRFCPYPNPPVRCIDVYSMGRKSDVTHRSLLKMAERGEIFYIYDTIKVMETQDPRQHRSLVANITKRSRYFVVNFAKIDQPSETHGQVEVGFRFFEGAGAGAIMIGEAPENEVFHKNFDWPDAVIHIPYNAENIGEILLKLDSQPKRLETARKNNVVHCLLRHDWVYRWRDILNIVGLEPLHELYSRENQLKELAKGVKEA